MRVGATAVLAFQGAVEGFGLVVHRMHPTTSTTTTRLFASSSLDPKLPSIERYGSDPFMKQVAYARPLVLSLSESENQETVRPLLEAQLSHSDGIRGFFATYLTMEPSTASTAAADQDDIPTALQDALRATVHNNNDGDDDLVSLACMNVVMPTAMTTMHTDPEQQNASRLTAERGLRILQHLNTLCESKVKENCDAMLVAAAQDAADNDDDDGLVDYWRRFYANWGYQETQLQDIVKAIKKVV